MRKTAFAYVKTKTQINCAGSGSLFLLHRMIVQSLYFLNPKFLASSHLLSMYSWFMSDLVGNTEDRFLMMRLIYDTEETPI